MVTAWEQGGRKTNTGNVTLWCDKDGEKLPSTSHSCGCGDYHARFDIKPGYRKIILSWGRKWGFELRIQSVESLPVDDDYIWDIADVFVTSFDDGEKIRRLPKKYEAVVNAALEKIAVYHCCYPYYYTDGIEDPLDF